MTQIIKNPTQGLVFYFTDIRTSLNPKFNVITLKNSSLYTINTNLDGVEPDYLYAYITIYRCSGTFEVRRDGGVYLAYPVGM